MKIHKEFHSWIGMYLKEIGDNKKKIMDRVATVSLFEVVFIGKIFKQKKHFFWYLN
jgi:hypothetical protein